MSEQTDEIPNDLVLSPESSQSIENKYSVSDLQKETENYPTNWNFSMKVAESQYRPPVEIPTEEAGFGVNRFVYLVFTDLSGDWTELPPVTPHQINVSRRIKKCLTGDLNENVSSYPVFPGTERNLLRTIITRISASTCIAPRNFFHTDGDEEDFDAEDDEERSMYNDKPVERNPSYRPWPIEKLLKLDYWEHAKPEILKQGRVSYFDGNILNPNSDDDDQSEISSNGEDEKKTNYNEIPIPLFSSCSGDRLINDDMSPWSIRLSDAVEKTVLVQSHVWPGAYAFVKEGICDNIYIGYGIKYGRNYAPLMIPDIAQEYPLDANIFESNDPTVDEEEIFAKKGEIEDEMSANEMDEDEDQ